MIETTFNMNAEEILRLRRASEILGISMSALVRRLLRNLGRRGVKNIRILSRVRYQAEDGDVEWKLFHLRMPPQLYEKCLDARKLFKCSVSFLLSVEIRENLEKIIHAIKTGNDVDNYSETYVIFCQAGENGHDYQVYNTQRERRSHGG